MKFQGKTAPVTGAGIVAAGGRAIACACDVSKKVDVDAAFATAIAAFGA